MKNGELKTFSHEDQLKELGKWSLVKRRLRWGMNATFQYLKPQKADEAQWTEVTGWQTGCERRGRSALLDPQEQIQVPSEGTGQPIWVKI